MSEDEFTCPKCNHKNSINDNELWRLYEEGDHDVHCDSCEEKLIVSSSVTDWMFEANLDND